MKTQQFTETTFKITLDYQEARILRSMMQNPVCHEESKEMKELRENLFEALTVDGDRGLTI